MWLCERRRPGPEGTPAADGRDGPDLAHPTRDVAARREVGLGHDLALSQKWANDYELTLAKDFVEHLDALPEGETGRLLIQVDGKDAAGEPIAAAMSQLLRGKTVLGLKALVGEVPSRPDGPAVACRVRLSGKEAMVQVSSSDSLRERG